MQESQSMEIDNTVPSGTGILADRFVILNTIGAGGNAKVKRAFDKQEKNHVAIKVMKEYDENTKNMVLSEAKVMSTIKNKYCMDVVKYGEGTVVKANGKQKTVLYIVLPLAQTDTLFDYIVECGAFAEPIACHFFKQFVLGMQAIHKLGICHRDIKCENVLFDDQFDLKIADFGYAAPQSGRFDQEDKSGQLFTRLGTRGQIAPEIEYLRPGHKGYSGHMVDVFNSGIILFCMCFRSMPFGQAVNTDRYYRYIAQDRPDLFWDCHKKFGVNVQAVSAKCRNLIFSLLQKTPELRPSISEILGDDWFAKTPKVNMQDLMKEFSDRRSKMDKQREMQKLQASQRALSSQSSAHSKATNKRKLKGQAELEGDSQRQFYSYQPGVATKFVVKQDPDQVLESLEKYLMTTTQCQPKISDSNYKLKIEVVKDLVIFDQNSKNGADDIEEEDLKRKQMCGFSIRFMDIAAKDKSQEGQLDFYVEMQKQGGDQDMFIEMYNDVVVHLLGPQLEE